ncbi:MAG: GIY-YIG nuclease family protein, partial [Phycisphaerales bacterium]|nr:GIY-YIG nuclease family protein [Phycisphaerales bacterium]
MSRKAATPGFGFTPKAVERLRYYVYLYIDPRDREPFYIGKGNRCFAHLFDTAGTEKVERINEIRAAGLEPEIEVLKHGLTEKEALLVESTAIDLIDVRKLTNKMRGHGSRHGSRASVKEIAARLDAECVEIKHPSLLIVINKLYRHDMT